MNLSKSVSVSAFLAFLLLACGPPTQPGASSTHQSTPPQSQPTVTAQAAQLIGTPPLWSSGSTSSLNPATIPTSRSPRNPALTRESAGVLLYTKVTQNHGDEIYVLFGKERSNGHWGFMRGSVDQGDSFVKTAAKEFHEETAGKYRISESVLLKCPYDIYHSARANNDNFTFFAFTSTPISEKNLTHASIHAAAYQMREMTDYAWIPMNDLMSAITLNQKTITTITLSRRSLTLTFDNYPFAILHQAYAKGILQALQ